jgi:clan AA aspartic protease (TIGR02281 family)
MSRRCPSVTIILMLTATLLTPALLRAEFYRYETESGEVFYVDDLTKVPEPYLDQVKTYPERYDHLSEDQRTMMLQKERDLDMQRALEEERLRKLREAEERRKRLETDVVIEGNQVLVPVTVVYGIKEVKALFLLDTGASHMVLFKRFARKLNLRVDKKAKTMVADGSIVDTEVTTLDAVRVGPLNMSNVDVGVIENLAANGDGLNFSGLLGMNILRNIEYSIDFENKKILWKPPS